MIAVDFIARSALVAKYKSEPEDISSAFAAYLNDQNKAGKKLVAFSENTVGFRCVFERETKPAAK